MTRRISWRPGAGVVNEQSATALVDKVMTEPSITNVKDLLNRLATSSATWFASFIDEQGLSALAAVLALRGHIKAGLRDEDEVDALALLSMGCIELVMDNEGKRRCPLWCLHPRRFCVRLCGI